MADFHLDIDCMWNKDGSFEEISNSVQLKVAELANSKGFIDFVEPTIYGVLKILRTRVYNLLG